MRSAPSRVAFASAHWLALAALLFAALAIAQQASAPAKGVVPLLQVSGAIGPATADYIARGLKRAARANAPLVVLVIDTPGGLDSSTRTIVKDILASPVPVATYVSPSGARAASAGVYIAQACQIIAMAPGTNLGAATPVSIGGAPGSPSPSPKPDDKASAPQQPEGDAMMRKVVNDSAAYLRSLAQLRGRNVEWVERAVREGVSLSAVEAHKEKVVEFIAADTAELLKLAHGRKVKTAEGAERVLDTANASTETVEPDWRTRLLGIVTEPTVAYLLLLLGIYGIYFEIMSPGIGVAGVTGVIALLLAMFALQLMPVSYAGVALIVLGFAMLVAEAFLPTFGALGIGGVIAFVIGSVMLIDTDAPGFGIPLGLIAAFAAVNVGFVAAVFWLAMRARRRPVVSGAEDLLGAPGEVLDIAGADVWVRVRSERWRAHSAAPLAVGQRVRVTGRDGLLLQVEPAR